MLTYVSENPQIIIIFAIWAIGLPVACCGFVHSRIWHNIPWGPVADDSKAYLFIVILLQMYDVYSGFN